jgi:hypothetical protein
LNEKVVPSEFAKGSPRWWVELRGLVG